MKPEISPQHILEQIAAIKQMERGKLSVIRQGPSGPYYNLQRWQDGRNHAEYVPAEQVAQVESNIESYHRFEVLVDQYAENITKQTRRERKAGDKKKPPIAISPSRKKARSKS